MRLTKRDIQRLAHQAAAILLRKDYEAVLSVLEERFREEYSCDEIDEMAKAVDEALLVLADRHDRDAAGGVRRVR